MIKLKKNQIDTQIYTQKFFFFKFWIAFFEIWNWFANYPNLEPHKLKPSGTDNRFLLTKNEPNEVIFYGNIFIFEMPK